jgi:hypothetical protein
MSPPCAGSGRAGAGPGPGGAATGNECGLSVGAPGQSIYNWEHAHIGSGVKKARLGPPLIELNCLTLAQTCVLLGRDILSSHLQEIGMGFHLRVTGTSAPLSAAGRMLARLRRSSKAEPADRSSAEPASRPAGPRYFGLLVSGVRQPPY